jgi:hypothetical protein
MVGILKGFGGLRLSEPFTSTGRTCLEIDKVYLARDEIRKRWDEVKGELTKDYKRRHREAIKRKRRGHGGAADVDGVE